MLTLEGCLEFYEKETLKYELDPSTVEPLSQETFGDLVSYYRSNQKELIIAVAKARSLEDPTTTYNFYFEAYLLNKTLFKQTNQGELLSRYHSQHPLNVKNPMTMLPIVGEVEYYMMQPQKLSCIFIGTDYTYVNSEQLREQFTNNAVKPEDCEFESSNVSLMELNRLLDLDTNYLEVVMRIFESRRNSFIPRVKVPFKLAVTFGIWAFWTLTLAAANTIIGARMVSFK